MWRVWRLLAALIVLVGTGHATAAITIGPFTFHDLAFADDATQIDAGTISLFGGAANLDDALTGFSPTKAIVNIGLGTNANHFQLDFTDLLAVNATGADLVFFDARFSEDPYEIAVRPVGSAFTSFNIFAVSDFVTTSTPGPSSATATSVLFALPIELDNFGLASGTVVDAIQFRSLLNAGGNIDGDPVMAAALNVIPEPSSLITWGLLALLGLVVYGRRRFVTRSTRHS